MTVAEVLNLRLARPADLAAVDGLLSRSYPRLLAADYPPSVLVTAVPLIARARPELLASGRYWLACDGEGRVVAAGGWSAASPDGGVEGQGLAHIRHVATDPALTRRGIGKALLTAAMAQARDAGFSRFDCLSTRTAVRFYAALGFVVQGEVDIALAPGIVFPAVRMRYDSGK